MNPILAALFPVISDILKRVLPDPQAQANAQLELLKLQQAGELELHADDVKIALAQLDVNKVEAASGSLFVAGWRPFIGWVCGVSLFCYYVPYTLAATVVWIMHVIQTGTLSARPDLGIADLIGLVMSMLGMAGLRTYDKSQDIATSGIKSSQSKVKKSSKDTEIPNVLP